MNQPIDLPLAALAPPGLGHAFFGSDGASATEIALKMAFHYWKNRGHPQKAGFVSIAAFCVLAASGLVTALASLGMPTATHPTRVAIDAA